MKSGFRKKIRKGFTLVEVIIVLVIIAIIAAIAVPNISNYIDNSKKRSCESMMNSFVNDLEYKVVSKRFYDINDLNTELAGVVRSYGEIDSWSENGTEIKCGDGQVPPPGSEMQVSDVCPNGGKYTLKWTITATEDENRLVSAKVNFGVVRSDIKVCECDCMKENNRVSVETHEFTAALISTHYDPEKSSDDDNAFLFLEFELVPEIESQGSQNPEKIKNLLSENSNDHYTVAGIVMNGSSVEWVCIYPDPREMDTVKFYTYRKNSNSLSAEAVKGIWTLESGDFTDLSKWPAAEGSAGSLVYKEGWNEANVIAAPGNDVKAFRPADAYDNAVDNAETDKLVWIQRDGQWYVQKNDLISGIDVSFSSETDALTPQKHPLVSDAGKELTGITVTSKSGSEDLKHAFKVNAGYADGSTVKFSHMTVKQDGENPDTSYGLENGYIFVSSEDDVNSKTWSGIFSGSSSDMTELEKLLKAEDKLIDDFLTGKNKTITIAYQEYFKSLNPENGLYNVPEPVTKFVNIVAYGSYIPDSSREYEVVTDEDKVDVVIPVLHPVKVEGPQSDEPLLIPVTVTKPLFGSSSSDSSVIPDKITVGEESVVRVEADESSTSYSVTYSQSSASDNKFSTKDITVTRDVTYNIYSTAGEDEKKIGSSDATETVKHTDGTFSGFFVGTESGYSDISYNEEAALDIINNGSASSDKKVHLYYYDKAQGTKTVIADITTGTGKAVWEYPDNQQTFTVDNLSVKITYPVNMTGSANTTVNASGSVAYELKHADSSNTDGFWLSASKNGTWSNDSALINQINDLSKTAYVTVKKSGDNSFTNKSVCRIDNTYESLTANYTNNGTMFSDDSAYSRLEVYGTYKITLSAESGYDGTTREIFHSVILNHDNDNNLNTNNHRYYTCVEGGLKNFDEDSLFGIIKRSIKTRDSNFLEEKYNNIRIKNCADFTAYVYFKDGIIIRDVPFRHDSTSSINPPDFVYFKTESALAAQSDDTSAVAHLVAYLGSDVNVEIPSSYTGYWTATPPASGGYAPRDGYYYVPDGETYNITRIGKYSSENLPVNATQATVSFRPGYSFQSLTISEGVKEIGPYAFYNAPVSAKGSVKIADSVETIGAYAFANAGNGNLSRIELGTVNQSSVTSSSTLKTIGASAFRDCSGLTDTAYFIIPSSVMSVGINAFDNFRMPGGTFVINGVSELGDDEKNSGSASQESSVTTVSALTVDGVKKTGIVSGLPFGDGSDENKKFTVNKLVVGGNTEVIGSGAFKAVNFEGEDSSVEITGYVSTVGDSAFKGTNFRKSLIFGSNVEIIENSAFEDCDQFTGSLNLNKIKEIRSDAFAGMTAVTGNLTVPGTVNRLDQGAFDGFASGNSNSETYPSLVINGCTNGSLGAGIFTNGHFKNVTISGNVRDISARAFKNSPLNGKVPYNEFKGTLTIGSSVDKIGLAAFEGCTGFTGNLVLPQNTGLTKIDDAAFNGCIGFSGTLTIPSNITEIGSRAFMNCVGFDGELILSSNLNKIGMEAFKNCTKFKKGLTVPSGITGGIGSCAFQKFASAVNDTDRGTLKLYSGSTAGGREIGAFIFTEAKFDGVIVGGTVEKIGASAFHHSNEDKLYLTSDSYIDDESRDKVETKENRDTLTADYSGITGTLVIESSVTDIDDMAFYACSGLTGTPMFNAHKNGNGEYVSSETEGVTHFGESAFEGCTGFSGELFVPKTTDSIERYAFKSYGNGSCSCSLRVYGGSDGTVLGSLREGEDYHPIFPSSSFTNVTIGGNVTEISPLFMDNDLIDSIEKKNGSVLSDADKSNYRYSGIRGTLTIESSVTRIGEAAFKKTQFTQIKGGVSADTPALSSVTYVGREAFDNCTQLSGMVSLSNAKTIENAAFRNCSSLRGDKQPGDLQLLNIETVGVSSFEGCTGFTGKLFLNGKNGTGLTSIGSDAFKSCTGLTGGVTIPESVTHIGTGAFEKFSSAGTQGSLEINGVSGKVNAEDEYGYISPGIFTGSYFKNVTIGGKVQKVKADAFRGCSGFTGTLTIGGVVETIENQAFDTCEYLTGISLENNHLSSIGEGAFARCRRVEDGLYIPSSVNHIDRCAFKYFAEKTPDAKLGTLKIYGTSDANGNLGNTVPDSDGGPLFSSARFNGVIIGGNVRTIAHNQFDNKRYYRFGTDLKYGDGSPVAYTEQFGGQNDNYDFSGISGDLTIEQGVTTIGGNAFACMNFDNVTIPRSVTDIGETAFMFAGSGNGKLKVLGTSASGQTLGNGEEHPIFLGAKFNGVVIGGNVKKIEKSFMHNKAGITDKELKQSNNEKNEEGADIRVAYRFNYTYNDIRGPLTIGNSVEEIGENAFESGHFDGRLILGEKLDESSPSDVRLYKIGMYAFKNCTKFNGDLIIPHSMKTIEEDAFYSFASAAPQAHTLVIWGGTSDNGNTLGNLKTNMRGEEVPVDIFPGAHFKDVAIGGNVHKIEKMAFKNDKTDARRTYDNIKGSLTLGPGVIEIRSEAFLKCKFDGKLGISDPDMVLHGDVSQSDYPDVTIGESAFKDLHDLYTNYTVKDRNGKIIRDSSGNPVQPEFIIPATVKSIGANAFTSLGLNIANKSDYPALKLYGCSLVNGDERVFGVSGRWDRKADIIPYANFRNVTIGGNITTIAENAFDNSSEKYIRFTGNLTIEKTVDKIWKEAFNECTGFDGALTIESLYDKNDTSRNDGLEKIGIKAFYGCTNFTGGLHIPYTVERIGSKAFSYFASDVPDDKDGLLNIEGYSDEKDVNFTVFNYNRTKARTIEADIFNHSKFENVSVGWNTEVIEAGFMKSYTKTETDEETGAETTEVFDYSGVTGSLYIGDNVVYIGNEAFSAEFGTPGFNGSLSFGDGNNYKKVIGQKAFARQQFTGDLKIPYTIGRIEESAFWCCDKFTGELVFNTYTLDKLQLIIPGATALPSDYGTDTIGVAAFSGCTGFYSNTTGKTLTIPSTVETLGENAFYKFGDDNNQDSVNYPGLEVLGGTKTNGTVILNKQIFPYSKFYDVTIGGKVSSIADDFMNNTIKNTYYGKTSAGNAEKVMYDNIKGKVTVKGTVNTIGNNAFKSLPLRGGLELENGVTTIGASAFEGCIYASGDITGERRLTIPSSVTSIGNYAFKNFGSMIYEQHLNKLFIYGTTHANGVLDSSQTDIFAGARFTDVTIGGNVRSVSEYCFSDYSKYGYFGGTLTIEKNSVTSLAQSDTNGQHGSFFGCNFNKVYLPESLYNTYDTKRWHVFGGNWNNAGFYNKLN